jgi:hypothetical protein
MANRVTENDVKAILDNTTLSTSQITPYITSANTLVNTALGTGTTDILFEIERWLAAHLIACTRERQAKKEEAGGAKIEYTGIYQEGLHSTTYGQMVLTLDTSGTLVSLMGKSAKITAIKSFS